MLVLLLLSLATVVLVCLAFVLWDRSEQDSRDTKITSCVHCFAASPFGAF